MRPVLRRSHIEVANTDPHTEGESDELSEEAPPPAPPFLIVGIGASAGGLEALTALLKAVTIDTMAFVVIQHLAPDHNSLLPEILGRSTTLPVHQITDGMSVEKNHVYVGPPNASVAILHGVLHLMSPSAPLPIDRFFRSLAEDQGPKAIGVVLSGMGSDGTQGLKEIKARGGLAFCQDPGTAKFESMPQSALDSGVVDRVLGPEALGVELMSITKHPYLARSATPASPASDRDELGKLFIVLRSAFGNDLSLYKPSTISRRIERRMALHKIERLADYVRFVQEDKKEQRALYQDVLISVTSFFRDTEPFDVIKRLILPRIIEGKAPGATIRFWVPACASGEEAYSLGICLLEELDQAAPGYNMRIFGTDVDEDAIGRARRGVYPSNIEADVSPERLRRFFVKTGKDYQVSRRLRDLLVFSPQNIARDAPFSRVDLVSCRNLLIYLQPQLQKRVLRLLHYALMPDGYLMLGTSETVGDCADLFSLVDRKNKIYVKKNLPAAAIFDARQGSSGGEPSPSAREGERRSGLSAEQIADRKLLDLYGPPSVLINENFEVLQFRGDTGRYLAPASGAATLNLLKLLRPELHVEVWRGVQQAFKENVPVRVGPVHLSGRPGEADLTIGVDIVPIHEPETKSRCLLVVFESGIGPLAGPPSSQPSLDAATDADARVRELEQGLAATREYLQATIEELETSNEELKSTNEELQSSNEELQSSNEELETSKEELQSTNEELTTMNTELQHRMSDLARSTSDLDNLLAYVEQPVLFFDSDLRLRRATDVAQKALELTAADLGRTIAQLKGLFGGADMENMVRTTVDRLVATTDQVQVKDRWYEARVVPYRSPGGVVDGALITLRDIDAEKRRRELVLDVKSYAEKVLAALPQPLAIVDAQLRVLWVNPPFLETFRVEAHVTIGNLLQNLGSGQWAHPKLRTAIESAFSIGQSFRDFRIEHDFENIGCRVVLVSGSLVSGIAGVERVLLLSMVLTSGMAVAAEGKGEADAGRKEPGRE